MWRNVTEQITGGRLRPLVSLGLLVAAVYGAALGFDFVRWDDLVNITHNPLVTAPWSRELLVKLVNGDTALRFKPLSWLLYRATYALFGFEPAAWHGLSLGLHLAAVGMCWAVLHRLLARQRPEIPLATRDLLAWLGAAVWAVHPAHVEPAVWATATPYPLMVFFLLASFWCYTRAMDPAPSGESRRLFVKAWWCAIAAYVSYPVGATYGLWLIVADIWIFRGAPLAWERRAEIGPWLWRQALFLLPAVGSVLVTWKSSSTTPWLYPAPATLLEVNVWVRLKMVAAMLASVWTHFFWPFGLTPNNPMLPAAMVQGAMILAMAGLAVALFMAAVFLRRRWPALPAVFFGSTVLALPVLGFTQWPTWAVADRHVYLPHLVFAGALVLGLAAWGPVARRANGFTGVAFVLVAALAWLGHRQVMIWRNTDTLFRYMEAQPAFTWNPIQQAYIYQLWGAQWDEDGQASRAGEKYTRARQVFQQGMIAAAESGRWEDAVDLSRRLEQAFGLPPVLRRARVRWLLDLGHFAEAQADLAELQRALPADPATEQLWQEWRQRSAGKQM